MSQGTLNGNPFTPPKWMVNGKWMQFQEFIDTVFNEDGSFNLTADYSPNPGEKNKNCRFCEFKDRKLCSIFQ